MAFTNIPANLQDMFNGIYDRLSKLETGPNQPLYVAEEAGAQATISLQAAIEANAAATQATYEAGVALAAANGKNTTHYSTSGPSGTGTDGDIWFQVNGSTGVVLYQYVYNAGTWNNSPISNTVIANLDAGKITAGTITGIAYNNGSGTFSVSPSGTLVATSATITGAITATSGSFTGNVYGGSGNIGGWYFNSAGLYNSSATASISSADGSVVSSGTSYLTRLSVNGATIGSSNLAVNGAVDITGNAIATGNITSQNHFYTPSASTTSNAGNTYINTGSSPTGRIMRSTSSSRRYKENIVNLDTVPELDPQKLYELPVRAFTYKEDYLDETDDRHGIMLPGFIAEEMDDIYPLAADYVDGVESWNDRMLVPAMLALIQQQNERIKVLEGRA